MDTTVRKTDTEGDYDIVNWREATTSDGNTVTVEDSVRRVSLGMLRDQYTSFSMQAESFKAIAEGILSDITLIESLENDQLNSKPTV